ncbi:hypothetical protein EQG49_00345 [Periweissella cryptocerci]|uniref:Uncharacterized protein n=1 Tax=Periweissella cryptocerci TaxID=2506420 RepID=A0A4P6YQX4_9LACO|nr:hypothetical protein [Periweissella cryptocerci]QBO35004.1 hypothetical protein EQG49_00345 [Periweissella cryptocerci]
MGEKIQVVDAVILSYEQNEVKPEYFIIPNHLDIQNLSRHKLVLVHQNGDEHFRIAMILHAAHDRRYLSVKERKALMNNGQLGHVVATLNTSAVELFKGMDLQSHK